MSDACSVGARATAGQAGDEHQDNKRQKQRVASQRYRQKQKAAEATCKQSLAALEGELAQWKVLAAAKRATAIEIRARIKDVSSELVRRKALRYAQRLLDDKHKPISACITRDSDSGSTQRTASPSSRETASSPFAELHQGAVPRWLREKPGYVRDPFRHTVDVRVCDALGAEGPVLAKLAAFRAGKARQLGCCVEDVCWAFRSERHPGLTEDGGITSHLGSPGCLARLVCLHFCAVLEWSCLLALAKRVDAARASASSPGRMASSHSDTHFSMASGRSTFDTGSAHRQQAAPSSCDSASPTAGAASGVLPAFTYFAEPTANTGSDDATVKASAQLAEAEVDMITENMCRQLALDPSAPNAAAVETHPEGGVRACIEAAMRHALRAILECYLPRMGAGDARRVLKHVRSGLGLRAIQALGPHEEVTPANAYVVGAQVLLQELNAAEARLQAQSHEPPVPANPEEVEEAAKFANEGLEGVRRDYQLLGFLVLLDNPRLFHGLGQQMRAASRSFTKIEELNLEAYQLLALSHEQKCKLARALTAYRQHVAAADAKHGLLVKDLDALLSATRQLVDHLATHLHAPDCGCGCSIPDAGVLLLQVLREPNAPGGLAEMLGAQQRLKSWDPSDQRADLLELLPELVARERRLLLGLQQVQVRKNELLIQFTCLLWSTLLTPRQLAIMHTAQLPFIPDHHRLPAMAATDLRSALVFNRPGPRALGANP